MGGDAESVVDTALKLRHVENIYVADASIMPMLVSGNTMAATYMIAERASAFIARDLA
jgi:choline dehydrogenase-like flavoprotein